MPWFPPLISGLQPTAWIRCSESFLRSTCPIVLCAIAGCASLQQLNWQPAASLPSSAVARDEQTQPPSDSDTVARIAARPSPARILAPKPFTWSSSGRSAGGRPFQEVTVGDSGVHTLIIGSVAGNDPAAVGVVESLARELHENDAILGGFQADVVRTLNPDGDVGHRQTNHDGVPVYRSFPPSLNASTSVSGLPPEVQYLISRVHGDSVQRIIHVRSIGSTTGVISSNSAAAKEARQVADWLGFRYSDLATAAPSGSLERMLVGTDESRREVIMFGIPSTMTARTAWETYGDALMNLLK
ncbi:MAG: hypothetical protein KDA96_02375 [Planctomycetaceae bacterium]|nr:hypothetical protein [Planctomycetaceae bacterium]